MDMRKIGGFLRQLRKERGMTQEQLAEALGVAGRTVSRWETAANLPDLSILIQLSEFYSVDIRDILDGERKERAMENNAKETLARVADYSEMEKRQLARVGRLAFLVTYFACAAAILAQLLLFDNWRYVLGETVALLAGGVTALVMTARRGLWEASSGRARTPLRDGALSLGMAALFTAVFALSVSGLAGGAAHTARFAAAFFAVVALVGYIVLRALAARSRRAREEIYPERPPH